MYKRLFCLVAILSFALSLVGQVNSAQKKADIDPAAMAALDKMGTFLRTLTVFQVKAAQTKDDVWDNGQAIQSSQVIDLLAARPNRFRAQIKSDDTDAFFLYNGKDFTVYGHLVNYYATVPAPPTIAELIEKMDEKYGIDMPLVDLFMWGSPQSAAAQAVTSAIDIGPGSVDGTTCEQYAFRQEGLDWQVWIQLGAYPLPTKVDPDHHGRGSPAAFQSGFDLEPGSVIQRRGLHLRSSERRAKNRDCGSPRVIRQRKEVRTGRREVNRSIRNTISISLALILSSATMFASVHANQR